MKFLQFGTAFQSIPGLNHFVTGREGGVSSGGYSGLNLAFHVGDDAQPVRENRLRLAAALGYDAGVMAAAQQVHGTVSRVVTRQDAGRGALDWEGALPDCDALITAEPGLPVLIQVADCAPILLVDPRHRALAVVHAGWRGAVGGIASHTLEKMSAEFGSRPAEVLCGIGPCLCAACFEVGEEVAAQAPGSCVVPGYPKPHLALAKLIEQDLTAAGVLTAHVETMRACPRCENERLFSHRAQQGKAGRFGLVAWWEGEGKSEVGMQKSE